MCKSLSSWRAWIEIQAHYDEFGRDEGRSPHGERGLKFLDRFAVVWRWGRSPHGERGLKWTLSPAGTVTHHVALLMESVD